MKFGACAVELKIDVVENLFFTWRLYISRYPNTVKPKNVPICIPYPTIHNVGHNFQVYRSYGKFMNSCQNKIMKNLKNFETFSYNSAVLAQINVKFSQIVPLIFCII